MTTDALLDTADNDNFGAIIGTLVGNDLDSGETASLEYAAIGTAGATNSAVAGQYGSLTVDEYGNYFYVPDADAINALPAGAADIDTFTVQTIDVHGATGTATLTVDVTGANDAPITIDDLVSVAGNTGSITGDLLGNDTDAEDDTLSVLSAVDGVETAGDEITVAGTYGELVIDKVTGDYTYTLGVTSEQAAAVAALGENITAQDDFTYTASDGMLGGDGHLTVTVTGINDAPTFTGSDLAPTYQAEGLSVALAGSVSAATSIAPTTPVGRSRRR